MQKLTGVEILNRIVDSCSGYVEILQIWRPSMTSQFAWFPRYGVYYDLFQLFFSRVLSEYTQILQIWRPNMTARIILVFETWRFYDFLLFFRKT